VTENGGVEITARDVCWSTSSNPTTSDNTTNDGSGTGSFTSEQTGLSEGTTYYVRAYATNREGTAYGEERSLLATDLSTIDLNDTLYVYPEDNATDIEWGGYGTEITDGNGAESDTDGEANTSAIVSQLGSDGHAAYVCDTLTAYGYSDRYLPAKDELNALYQNKDAIGGFSSNNYWSSTENDANNAWNQNFNNGNQNNYNKNNNKRVRCVRRDCQISKRQREFLSAFLKQSNVCNENYGKTQKYQAYLLLIYLKRIWNADQINEILQTR